VRRRSPGSTSSSPARLVPRRAEPSSRWHRRRRRPGRQGVQVPASPTRPQGLRPHDPVPSRCASSSRPAGTDPSYRPVPSPVRPRHDPGGSSVTSARSPPALCSPHTVCGQLLTGRGHERLHLQSAEQSRVSCTRCGPSRLRSPAPRHGRGQVRASPAASSSPRAHIDPPLTSRRSATRRTAGQRPDRRKVVDVVPEHRISGAAVGAPHDGLERGSRRRPGRLVPRRAAVHPLQVQWTMTCGRRSGRPSSPRWPHDRDRHGPSGAPRGSGRRAATSPTIPDVPHQGVEHGDHGRVYSPARLPCRPPGQGRLHLCVRERTRDCAPCRSLFSPGLLQPASTIAARPAASGFIRARRRTPTRAAPETPCRAPGRRFVMVFAAAVTACITPPRSVTTRG